MRAAKTYDAQPHQVVVVAAEPSDGTKKVFLPTPWRREAYTDLPAVVLTPGVPTLVDARVLAEADGAKLLKRGVLRISDGSRGVLPELTDLQDTARRAELRDGKRPSPNRAEILNDFRQRYIEHSLGECVLVLMEHGWSEADAAAVLVKEYESAFLRRDGSVTRQSWVKLTEKILANNGQGVE
jgi:hypothetical protein